MYTYKLERCKVPIKVWSEEGSIESGAMEQIENAASLPFAFHHVALMPDGHQGTGAPIGGILATKDILIPNYVGSDGSCGMVWYKTPLSIETYEKHHSVEDLKQLMQLIREDIPVGFNHQEKEQDETLMPNIKITSDMPVVERQYKAALKQLGTLGQGNHFWELQKGDDGYIHLMIHSGSRNIGKQVCDYYNRLAVTLNERWCSSIPKAWQLAFLPIQSKEGAAYYEEMKYCIAFAKANRALMMKRSIEAFDYVFHIEPEAGEIVDVSHNYCAQESHFNNNVFVHRKGAIRVREGEIGIIPGSMGTSSYIVQGLGNQDSFMSASHGAGRKLGRKAAKEGLVLADEINKMGGIVHGIRHKDDLDEAPGSYKDISEVMNNQTDLVKVLIKLEPLGNVKG